jgi:hypothetical protein
MSNKTRLPTDKLTSLRMVRFRVTDMARNDDTGTQLGVKYVNETVKEQRKKLYAHIEHKGNNRPTKSVMKYKPHGRRGLK